MKKRGRDDAKLVELFSLLINELPLMPKHENHPLHGKYQGKWEYHIEPDWVLIYRIDDAKRKIVFYRFG